MQSVVMTCAELSELRTDKQTGVQGEYEELPLAKVDSKTGCSSPRLSYTSAHCLFFNIHQHNAYHLMAWHLCRPYWLLTAEYSVWAHLSISTHELCTLLTINELAQHDITCAGQCKSCICISQAGVMPIAGSRRYFISPRQDTTADVLHAVYHPPQ